VNGHSAVGLPRAVEERTMRRDTDNTVRTCRDLCCVQDRTL